MTPEPSSRLCRLPHYDHPETICTEPAGHYQPLINPHAGPLIINGRHSGGAAWDSPTPPSSPVTAPQPPNRPRLDQMTDDTLDALYSCLEALETPAPDSLRDQYATAIRPVMLMGLQDAELDGAGGTQRINEWTDWIATALAAVRDTEMQRLRDRVAELEQQLARLHAGEEPHHEPAVVATPAQWIRRWNRANPHVRLEVAARVLADGDRAYRWVLGNHESQLDADRRRAERAEAALARVQAVADEWGEPYHCGWLSASVLVRQLHAALDEPTQPKED